MSDDKKISSIRRRFLDINKEPNIALPPLPVVKTTAPILSLHESVKNLHHLIEDLDGKVTHSLDRCQTPSENLSVDESAALYLYSLEWPKGQHSFYTLFNRALRSEDRTKFLPFQFYFHLFISALNKLPSIRDQVWRGVNGDISDQYEVGSVRVWWGVSSCTDTVHVTDSFVDKSQPRTLFNIKCHKGKSIRNHSEYSNENETILAPGTYIRVVSKSNPAENLHIIQCEQIDSETEEEMTQLLASISFIETNNYLLWVDRRVNQSETNLDIQNQFQRMFADKFFAFDNIDQYETFIKQMEENDFILIVSGRMGRELIPTIHNQMHLKSIFIYCKNKEKNEEWAKNYEKIKRVIVDSKELLEQIKDTLPSLVNDYDNQPLVSLEEAIEPLISMIPDIQRYALDAKQKCTEPADNLTADESASIMLYTMEFHSSKSSLYREINQALRSQNALAIRPFHPYLKLILHALSKLPSFRGTVWRGVKMDFHQVYKRGDYHIWRSFTAATPDGSSLYNSPSLPEGESRTLFLIQCQSGKRIRNHSYFPVEDEVMLLPGFRFKVISALQTAKDMHLIQIEEMNPIQ